MLQEHFARFGKENHIFELTAGEPETLRGGRGVPPVSSPFFPTTTPASAAGFGSRFPYDDVDYAEDQFWARKILEAGYGRVYCPYAGVYHSHNYPLTSYGKRYYDDFKAMYRVYGMVLCPTAKAFLRGLCWGISSISVGYILRQGQMTWKEKIYWCYYAATKKFNPESGLCESGPIFFVAGR